MIRTVLCAAASLLLICTVYADDKEKTAAPEQKSETKAPDQATPEKKPETAAPERARRSGARPGAPGHRGRVTKASIENEVLKLTLDGKEYEFAITEHTHAMLRTEEKDGKEKVIGLYMMNGDMRQRVRRPAGQPRTRPKTKP